MNAYISRTEFEAAVDRLDHTSDQQLHAVINLRPAEPPAAGRLQGLAIGVKDNIECRGLPGSAGSVLLAATPAQRDAELVTRLKNAGADIVASLNLSEWANFRSTKSTSGWSAVGGLTANPWQPGRSAGGSSSGSGAAVAAGLLDVAIGTETDGSIVCPASLNGVVGIKPTVGSVSRHGVVPISNNQDTPGPIAIDVPLAARVLDVLTGGSAGERGISDSSRITAGLKVGVAEAWLTGHAETDAVFEHAVKVITGLVSQVGRSQVPAADEQASDDEYTVLCADLYSDLAAYLQDRLGPTHPLTSLEAVISANLEAAEVELRYFDQDIFEHAVANGGNETASYAAARSRNLQWAREVALDPAFAEFDLLVAPTYGPAWQTNLAERSTDPRGELYTGGKVTAPAAIAGYPLLCLPMGLAEGLPVGLTIAAPPHHEHLMIALAVELEKRLGCRPTDGFLPPLHASR